MKRCARCKQDCPLLDFNRRSRSKDGHSCYCRPCEKAIYQEKRAAAHERYVKNKERILAQHREWKQANKEHIREQNKDYRQRKAEARNAYNRQYYHTHIEAKRAYHRAYKAKRRADYIRFNILRRTRVTGNGGSYTLIAWHALCKRYGFRCLSCMRKLPYLKLTVDHVIPVTKGGSSDIDNLQPLCQPCNSQKNDRTIDYRIHFEERLAIVQPYRQLDFLIA